jgi:hypothetical protein
MIIDGVSQTTGLERVVEIGASGAEVLLAIRDRKLGLELGRTVVPADALMSVLSEQPKGLQRVSALEIEVRKNEVWLTLGGPDAAVGLDDLLDAVAGSLPS